MSNEHRRAKAALRLMRAHNSKAMSHLSHCARERLKAAAIEEYEAAHKPTEAEIKAMLEAAP